MRLDKFLQANLDMKKPDRKRLFNQGKLLVDGQAAKSLRQNIDSQLQEIKVDGQIIQDPTQVYYMMNKPSGVITAVTDAEKTTVLDLVEDQDRVQGLYPIGRLDRFTSGLLLLTNNGPLGLRMLHPDHHVAKTYQVQVKEPLAEWMVAAFKEGITIDQDILLKPAELQILSDHQAQVTVSEGKYHQVKKMFLSVGLKVEVLKRLTFGPFQLDERLEPGQYRRLNQEELTLIKTYLD